MTRSPAPLWPQSIDPGDRQLLAADVWGPLVDRWVPTTRRASGGVRSEEIIWPDG